MARCEDLELLQHLQFGVLTREQALHCGITGHGLQHRIRPAGPWQRLLPGVYLTSTGTPTAMQLNAGAWLYAGMPSMITGLAALRFYETQCPDHEMVDVLVEARRKQVSTGYVAVHRTRRLPARSCHKRAIAFAPPERAVADAVAGVTDIGAARTVVASAVQRRLCSVDRLTRELAARRAPGNEMLRAVLAEVADGVRSAPEGELRGLVRAAGLPCPLYNPDLYLHGKFLARPDAWWEAAAVAVEVDSMKHHLLPADWANTVSRHSRMTAAGILVLHYSPKQLRAVPATVIREISAALQAGRPAAGIVSRPVAA